MNNPNPPALLPERFRVKLTMKSDWHVGSGTGRPGDIDSLVRRDGDDLPFVPAKTLTGIWRDACETVADGLDQGDPEGIWHRLLAFIFGDQVAVRDNSLANEERREQWMKGKAQLKPPRPAQISVRSAHLSQELRNAIKARPQLREAITFVKPGISIDPRTGQARSRFLRFEEMARVGAELCAQCELRLPARFSGDQKRAIHSLLIAGASFVERLGGNRRRGAGRSSLEIDGVNIDSWLDWLEENVTTIEFPFDEGRVEENKTKYHHHSFEGELESFSLQIMAETRLVIPDRVVGNLVKSLDYIPGTHLLPFITQLLGEMNGEIRSAISQGDLLITNATPLLDHRGRLGERTDRELHPTRVVPFVLAYQKLGGGLKHGRGVFNRMEDYAPDGQQLKGYRGGYIGEIRGKRLPSYEKPSFEVETHNVVEDEKQRPTEAVGGVFSYQSIKAGTCLDAELRIRESLLKKLPENWKSNLEQEQGMVYRIGRARKDDYGLVRIRLIEDQSEDAPSRHSVDSGSAGHTEERELRVWLLSDMLLRDERLRPTASIDRFSEVLGEKLGAKLELKRFQPQIGIEKPKTKMSFAARQNRIDSWHTQWNLPRPSLAGLAAGSCFIFKVSQIRGGSKEFNENCHRLSRSGLGERCAEGFGQLSFDDPLLYASLSQMEDPRSGDSSTEKKEPFQPIPYSEYARLIEKEGWRKEIRRRALTLAVDESWRKSVLGWQSDDKNGIPTMSQLGALRSVLRRIREPELQNGEQLAGPVTQWCDSLKESKNRAGKWPEDCLEQIKHLAGEPAFIWNLLTEDWPQKGRRTDFSEFTITNDGVEEMQTELWAEAVGTLIDACISAHKRDLERRRTDSRSSRGGHE